MLDGMPARAVAFLVFLGCVALLAWIHRDDLLPGEPEADVAENDPAAPCIAERTADIERMVEEGLIEEAQADLFKQRAIGMCRDQAGGGEAGPSLPGLPAR
ncbi:MAG: hypothetical protein R3349_02220 [Geminicoccaceae bacterium]|nr:hypothetical protein [Geminicoccaceae bacterium]